MEQQQQQQNNPPHLHTPNKSASMPELSNLIPTIREVDADILEQGVEEKQDVDIADFDNQGRRLEARSESNISLSELLSNDINKFIEEEEELISLSHSLQSNSYDEHDDIQQHGGSLIIGSGENLDESRNDTLIATQTQSPENIISTSDIITTETISNSMPPIAESESCHIPHPDNTKVEQPSSVAETESCSSNDWSFLDTISPPNQSGLYPTSKQLQQTQEIYHDALNKRIVSGRVHHRSVSFDRRISESAQFAEAVGEEPNTLLLKKIIEEDSSSDFDDDEIDEEAGDNLEEEGGGEGHADLVDYHEDGGAVEVIKQRHMPPPPIDNEMAAGESSSEKMIEPISTDIAKISLKEGVCSSSNTINQELLSHLSASLEVDSAPTTPAPSPCKQSKVTTTSFHPPCYVDWKFTRQYSSGSNLNKDRGGSSVPNSPQEANNNDFAYKGIRSKYLEVTKRGMARGNYAQLHRKAWLEVSDKHHRYGKNLRLYYKHWESIGHPYHMFFYWLDSIKEGAGNPLPSLPELPRSVLDSDTVLYITDPEISATYALDIVADPVDGSALILDQNGCPISTGKEGWIFVLRDHVLYGSQKVTAPPKPATSTEGESESATAPVPRQRFHHSSFFGGKAVASAGIFLTDDQGRLTQLYPHSGHYRPGEAHMQRALFFFQQLGVDLSTFLVDMQQIFKVSRAQPPGKEVPAAATTTNKNGDIRKYFIPKNKENNAKTENGKNTKHNKVKKSKKVDNLHLMCGLEVACFLAHKALMIEKGVFTQIHRIRRILPKESRNSVRLVLAFVNESC